jgi:hypothetical protein
MSTLPSNGLSEADQREAAWSNFCRETPVHLRGPWEAFVWAWEARKHSNETGEPPAGITWLTRGKPDFAHWRKDSKVPYSWCDCVSCSDARNAQNASEGQS